MPQTMLRWTLIALVLLSVAWLGGVHADRAQYIYDDLGRLSQVIDGQGDVATYTYDAVGNLLFITRNTGGIGAPNSGIAGRQSMSSSPIYGPRSAALSAP